MLQLEGHRGVRRVDDIFASRGRDGDRRRGGGFDNGGGGFGGRRGGRGAGGEGEEEEARAGNERFHVMMSLEWSALRSPRTRKATGFGVSAI